MKDAIIELNRLKEIGIIRDYAVAGGIADSRYVEPIVTYDLDIFILMDNDRDYSELYKYFTEQNCKIENVHIFIGGSPVQFLPSYIHPLYEDALRRACKEDIEGAPAKILTAEHLIAVLLMAFRLKDRQVIPYLLEKADVNRVNALLKRFDDESATLRQRFDKLLANLQP